MWWRLLFFILLSLAGLVSHLNVHPVSVSFYNWWGPGFNVCNIVVVPLLFLRAGTAGWGLVLACLTVAAGTVGMAHNSLVTLMERGGMPVTAFLGQTPVMIAMVLPAVKVPLAVSLYRRHRVVPREGQRGCRA